MNDRWNEAPDNKRWNRRWNGHEELVIHSTIYGDVTAGLICMWVRIPGDWPVTLTRIKLIQLDLVGLERQMARSNFPEKKEWLQ